MPICNLFLQILFWFWLLEDTGTNISKLLIFIYIFDTMVSILFALDFKYLLLFYYYIHEDRFQHSITDTRVHCSILIIIYPWKIYYIMQICKDLFSSNVQFFAEGRPDGVRKYGKIHPKYGNIRPA